MQITSLLSSELQLGQQLNQSVEGGDNANFALLLSMLSNDVCQQSQFNLPRQDAPSVIAQSMRDKFELPVEQTLLASDHDGEKSLALGKVAQEEGMTAAWFNHCLNPDALSFVTDKKYGIDTQVFDNLDSHCAARFTNTDTSQELAKIDLVSLLSRQQAYQAHLI